MGARCGSIRWQPRGLFRPAAHRWCNEDHTRRYSCARIASRAANLSSVRPLPSSAAAALASMTQTGESTSIWSPGIGVASLGHAHAGLAAAIAEQAPRCIHTSNLYFHPFQAEAAERLAKLSGLPRAFFCNSGTEANEACLKFARRYWHTKGRADTHRIRGYRRRICRTNVRRAVGDTRRSLSPTLHAACSSPSRSSTPRGPDALAAAVTDRTAAIIAEPIRGEGGVHPLSREFADAIAEACHRTGALLIADEVQTGLGRTGYPFHSQALGWTPDLISVGKALGSGVPVGAALVSEQRSGDDFRRRSRQHLRRQPARDARGRVRPRAADGPRRDGSCEDRRPALRAAAARARAEASGDRGGPWGRSDARPRAAHRCGPGHRSGAGAGAARQSHCREESSGCCRRSSSRQPRSIARSTSSTAYSLASRPRCPHERHSRGGWRRLRGRRERRRRRRHRQVSARLACTAASRRSARRST